MMLIHSSKARTASLMALLLALAFVTQANAADKATHIFILTGQSNMQGMDPKAGFLPEAKTLFPNATIAHIKVARGGQPIRLWVNEWNEIAKRNGLSKQAEQPNKVQYYQPILDQYRKLLKEHPNPTSVTFCWMQGERDAREQLGAAYVDALQQLISNLRRDLKQPKMNVVIGRISDFKNGAYAHWDKIRLALVEVANKDPRGAWVDCDDLNNKVKNGKTHDDLHYTKKGYELLGRRYARQAKALIDGKEPASNGRP